MSFGQNFGKGLSWGDIPFVGGFLGESRADKAGKDKLRIMQDAAQHYARYRPIQMQQHQNSLASQMAALQPTNNALGQMYGPGAQLDMDQILQSPVVTQDLWPAGNELQQRDQAAAKQHLDATLEYKMPGSNRKAGGYHPGTPQAAEREEQLRNYKLPGSSKKSAGTLDRLEKSAGRTPATGPAFSGKKR